VGLEPTIRATANTCFRDRPLIRPDDFRLSISQLRGLESNQRPPGSEPGVTTSSNCPAVNESSSSDKVRGEGFEPSSPASKAGSLPLADPRAIDRQSWRTTRRPSGAGGSQERAGSHQLAVPKQKCPAGVEPASPAWKAGASAARPRAHVQFLRRKPWDSNPQASGARLLFSRQVPHPAGWLP
jgi:hypothetical protein